MRLCVSNAIKRLSSPKSKGNNDKLIVNLDFMKNSLPKKATLLSASVLPKILTTSNIGVTEDAEYSVIEQQPEQEDHNTRMIKQNLLEGSTFLSKEQPEQAQYFETGLLGLRIGEFVPTIYQILEQEQSMKLSNRAKLVGIFIPQIFHRYVLSTNKIEDQSDIDDIISQSNKSDLMIVLPSQTEEKHLQLLNSFYIYDQNDKSTIKQKSTIIERWIPIRIMTEKEYIFQLFVDPQEITMIIQSVAMNLLLEIGSQKICKAYYLANKKSRPQTNLINCLYGNDYILFILVCSKQNQNIIRKTNIHYTDSQELQQQKTDAKEFFLCKLPFKDEKDKVIDHNHLTGEVRGIAHNNFNLHFHLQKTKIPVIFHNLKGYYGHFIVKQIGVYMKKNNLDSKIDVIANNSEKFMCITWKNVRFIDSAQFMNLSLEKLGKNLQTNQKTYTMNYLIEEFGDKLNQQKLEQIINKGIFPYSWFDNFQNQKISNYLKKNFFYDLTNEQIDEEKYNQAVELFNKQRFKSFKQWLQLYQTIDIKLLTDVWINFRNNCLETYGLEPGHYFTSPGLAWDAMLKITKIRLDLITDPDMYLMFERQSRGGISKTGNLRYAQANNKYCDNYDDSKSYTQLMYFDANNLYGQAISQKLPYRNFTFIKEDKFKDYKQDFILKYNNTKFGYVCEVDLEYPINLHDQHNAYPLTPEQVIIKFDQLSKYNKDMINQLKVSNGIKYISGKQKKLTPNLMDKVRYVCNIRNLKLYLKQGLKLVQIHRIIKYEQSNFMEDYINLNTQKRQQATNEFEKDFYKLMNNSVFGKTMQNVRNRESYELVFSKKRLGKIIKSRYLKNFITITENLALVERYKKTVKLDKPAYVGMQILDLSKIVMYNYYYNHLLKEFSNVGLIMADTDSLFVQVHCSEKYDMFDSMIKNSQFQDFSKVEEGDLYEKIKQHCIKNKLYLKKFINKNKAVIGLMKNEVPNSNISEAISIKAKCCDFITSNKENKKKLKGIKQYVVKQKITHNNYKDCVVDGKIKYVEQNSLRSFNHEMFTITQEKIALTAINGKRYVLEDGINTPAYGNYKIINN